MGGAISQLLSFCAPAPQTSPPLDPRTCLTQADRQAVTQTWSFVADTDCVKTNPVELFILLFAAYPYTMDYFEEFKGKPLSALKESPKLRVHATKVFYTITSYVENVDDPEILIDLIQKVAESHMNREVTVKEFEDLKTVFLKFLKSQLGSKWTPQAELSWNKLLTVQNTVLQAKQAELASKK